MKLTVYEVIFLLLTLSISVYAQKRVVTIDEKQIALLDNSYSYRDTIEKLFLKTNIAENWSLRQQVNKLRFDHCNHNEIELLLYCDTSGAAKEVQLITGTALTKIDSSIIALTKSYSTKFKAVSYNYKVVNALIILKYRFHDLHTEEMLEKTNGNYPVSDALNKFQYSVNLIHNSNVRTETTECDNDSYFYNGGVKLYQQGDYKGAAINFKQAVDYYEYDFDALYNLGLAYQKVDKLKKACECFSNGQAAGDTNSVKAFNKYCVELNKK